jgi:hypothetical protein
VGTTAELIAEAREWLRRTPPHHGTSTRFVRRLADALDSATKAIDEAGFADARRRVEQGKLFTAADVAPLLAAVAQRDQVIDDALKDAGRVPQDATPPEQARQRADRLRELLRPLTDSDYDDHLPVALLLSGGGIVVMCDWPTLGQIREALG